MTRWWFESLSLEKYGSVFLFKRRLIEENRSKLYWAFFKKIVWKILRKFWTKRLKVHTLRNDETMTHCTVTIGILFPYAANRSWCTRLPNGISPRLVLPGRSVVVNHRAQHPIYNYSLIDNRSIIWLKNSRQRVISGKCILFKGKISFCSASIPVYFIKSHGEYKARENNYGFIGIEVFFFSIFVWHVLRCEHFSFCVINLQMANFVRGHNDAGKAACVFYDGHAVDFLKAFVHHACAAHVRKSYS